MAQHSESWIDSSDVISMFPTLVWKLQPKPDLRLKIETNILALLQTLRREQPSLAPGQGWQSESSLHQRQELNDLVSCVNSAAQSVLRFLKIGESAIDITGCWATVLRKSAEHRIHTHPNNFLSGVYYLRTHQGADTINFHDPRSQAGIIRPPVMELSAANTDQVVVNVMNGTLLMFPSYLQHSVAPNMSEEERISISFNLMFPAFAEKLAKPLW